MSLLKKTSPDLHLRTPSVMVATFFGAGWLPRMPGTWGALAALPFAWLLSVAGGPWLMVAAAILLFLLGLWAADRYMDAVDVHDPGAIVVDEVAAQWLTLAFVPPDVLVYLLGFILFRAFDVLKPFPVSWLDRRVGGSIGVMIDDVVAALYAMLALWLIAAPLGLAA
jgi:phosphatidylglycerophosphatase A